MTADLEAATALLYRRLNDYRLAAVIRRPSPMLDGRSLLEMAGAGGHAELRKAVEAMFALPR